jgi:hypothetical protein
MKSLPQLEAAEATMVAARKALDDHESLPGYVSTSAVHQKLASEFRVAVRMYLGIVNAPRKTAQH